MDLRKSQKGKSPSRMIDERIKELGDWRAKMLLQLRTLIKQADPEAVSQFYAGVEDSGRFVARPK